jgi:DNA (cytosine-5)-methyltransferase 1
MAEMPNLTLPPLHDRPLSNTERAGVIDRVDELLHVTYREQDLGNFEDPLQEVVYILLSLQIREPVYQRVSAELLARWPTWQALLAAPLDEVRQVILPAGFPYRAAQLQELLAIVAAECERRGYRGQITLDWLHEMPDDEAIAFLDALPGIGEKSARCVLHYALGRPTFAVDTHVRRILHRLGIVHDRGGKVKHSEYDAVIPARMRQRLHVNLVHHGRAVCTTQKPKCSDCPLISFCATGRAAAATSQDGRPEVVEVFAGGGGMGAGFAAAGYRITLAIDMDRHAAQTYRANHPGTIVLEADATEVTQEMIKRLAPGALAPTVIVAGPPCQGYSAAGARDPGDIKNMLYREVARLARSLRPRFVVIENVPGMRKVSGVSFVRAVLAELDEAGYDAQDHLLRSCDFGVPQLRHRILYLAQQRALGQAPPAPAPTHCPGKYCSEGCGDLPGSRCDRASRTPSVVEALAGLPVLPPGEIAEHRVVEGAVVLNASISGGSAHAVRQSKPHHASMNRSDRTWALASASRGR